MQRDPVASLWIGQITPLERLCILSFLRQGHVFKLYTYGDVGALPEGVTVCDANEILPESAVFRNRIGFGAGSVAGFSDVFRFKLLLDQGGWWVDTDVFCLRPFDFPAPYVLGAEDKPVASGVIKAPAGSELMGKCFNAACRLDRTRFLWNDYVNILAKTVREQGLMHYVVSPDVFSPILWRDIPRYVLGKRVFRPSPHSYAVHLYNEVWRCCRFDKNATYPPTSVFEILKRRLTDPMAGCAASNRRPSQVPPHD